MGRLAGVKLKGRLTLEVDKEVNFDQLLSLLVDKPQSSAQSTCSTDPTGFLPLFPQPYLSSPSKKKAGKTGLDRKMSYQSPDIYPVSGGLLNKGEGVTLY